MIRDIRNKILAHFKKGRFGCEFTGAKNECNGIEKSKLEI